MSLQPAKVSAASALYVAVFLVPILSSKIRASVSTVVSPDNNIALIIIIIQRTRGFHYNIFPFMTKY